MWDPGPRPDWGPLESPYLVSCTNQEGSGTDDMDIIAGPTGNASGRARAPLLERIGRPTRYSFTGFVISVRAHGGVG